MSFTAAFLMIAQSAAPALSAVPATQPRSTESSPVAVQATASVRVVRAARIAFDEDAGSIVLVDKARNAAVQRGRDQAGTYWVEFS